MTIDEEEEVSYKKLKQHLHENRVVKSDIDSIVQSIWFKRAPFH